jgi:ABC-type oligopeptide transport system substrate-binding subunit
MLSQFVKLLCFAAALASLVVAPLTAATLNRGLGPEPDSLHIHQAQGLAAVNLLRDIREGLVTFDVSGEPVPGQAESWQVLDSGSRYRFTLRADARWSNGDPVTADDFVRAWRRAVTPATAATTAGLLKDVRHAEDILGGSAEPGELGIRAIGPQVVEVELEQAAPWILEILAHPVSFPLHSEGMDDPRVAPVNGPFLLQEWAPRASIQLVRNEQFYGAGSVALDAVDYHPIEEPATELALYRAGELHITETIPAGRFAWLRENLPNELRVYPYLGSFWLGLNLNHPLLGQSPELRRALALAINREILVGTVLGAGELVGWGVVPPGIAGYQPATLTEDGMSQDAREAEARRLYQKSGAGEPDPLLLELRYNTSGVHRRVAVAIASMWKQVLGVNTELVNEEWKVFVNNRRLGIITQVFRGGWIADYADPSSFLDLFSSGSSLNNTFYRNARFDGLLESAKASAGAVRMQLLREAEAQLLQDMPVIPLYYYVSRHLVNPAVAGYQNNVRDVHLSRYLDLELGEP